MIYRPGDPFSHDAAQGTANEFEIHTAHHYRMFFQVSHGYADRIGDIGLGPGLFETLLVRLQVGEMQEVLGTDVLEQDLILVIIKKDLKILGAADPVMVIAFVTNEEAFPQFRDRTYIIAIRAFCP